MISFRRSIESSRRQTSDSIELIPERLQVKCSGMGNPTRERATVFVDVVSVPFAKKISDVLGYINVLKCNQLEAEVLSHLTISSEEDARLAGEKIYAQGVDHVLLSLGQDGVLYYNQNGAQIFRPEKVS